MPGPWTEADLIAMMDDTSGYFPAGDWSDMRPHLLVLYTLARYATTASLGTSPVRGPVCLEIGVRQGVSTLALLMAMRRTGGTLVSVDCDPVETAVAQRIVREQGLEAHWRFHLCRSDDFTPPSQIDFLWIDGDHRHPQPSHDVTHFAPHLRVGGILALHDYLFPPEGDDGVQRAVEEILRPCGAFEIVTLPWSYGLTICRKLVEVEVERGVAAETGGGQPVTAAPPPAFASTVEAMPAIASPAPAPAPAAPTPEPFRWE